MENTSQHLFETRQYQVELIERIKQSNAILFLPTGSGKTYIALEIIKYMENDLQKLVSFGGKRTIFLVNTVALAEQHYSFLEKHSSFRIKMLTGESRADQMDADKWSLIEDNFQILLMTCQVYFNALTHADLYLKNANLIIFDECHHAVNKHPMREVMRLFNNCDENNHPKVLGLSATLINGNTDLQNFTEELTVLQKTFRSKIITSSRVSEVKKFSTKAKEIRQQTVPYESPTVITNKIKDWIRNYVAKLKNMTLKSGKFSKAKSKSMNDRSENRRKLLKNCLHDLEVHLEEYGLYFCYKGCECYISQLDKILSDKSHEKDYCNAVLLLRTLLVTIRKVIADEISRSESVESTNVIAGNSAEKLRYLLDQLRNFSPTDKCIIFVERRITANILSKIIRIFFEERKSKTVVDFMIGSSPHPLRNFKEEANDRKRNKEVMTNFRCGKTNILVASNVLEEGIDMPDCNVVFMYDFPKTYRSYVQSKGRARDENSSYVIFIDKDTEQYSKLQHFQELEKKLEEVVPLFDVSSGLEHEEPSGRDEETYTTRIGATITQAQAIPIINKYCSTLPHDKFTQSDPDYRCSKEGRGYSCQLKLPTNAVIKKIIKGPVRPNRKESKEAVAFKAVKRLHEMNALDDSLKPVLALFRKEDEQFWFPHWSKNDTIGDGIKSGKKEVLEKEEVSIKVPKYLENSRPIANKTCYLHVINMKAMYPKPETRRRKKCDELLTSENELGIITREKIPKVCDFPVFADLGELRVDIDSNHRSLKLSHVELSAVSRFHRILFLEALQVINKFLIYSEDPDDTAGYFVVPLKPSTCRNGMEINFEVVFNQCATFDVEKLSVKERVEDYNNYRDCVVFPHYLKNQDKKTDCRKKFYVVTDVNKNETLQSRFPNKHFASYADYFEKHHGLKSQKPNQPLLEARQMPHNLNYLRPRGKAEKQENEINLVAEFCLKFQFPAVYWYKATCLPTVLHRLNYLLLAEEIRERIVTEKGIGVLEWNKDDSDVLEVYDKYDCRKSSNTKQDAGLKKKSNDTTETSRTSGRYFSNAPPLMTLKKRTNYEGPSQKDIFEAITPRECNDILDLERLEILGDSFLKFAVSFTAFVKCSEKNEGYLTQLKGRLVGNQNLFYCGNNFNLGSYINVNTFSAVSNWCPPGFTLLPMLKEIRSITDASVIFHMEIPTSEQFSGTISSKTLAHMKENVKKYMSNESTKSELQDEKHALMFCGKQSVGRKTIADVIEALIGVYVKTGGIKPAFQLLNYFGIIAKPTYEDVMGTRGPSPVFEKSELTSQDFKKLEKLLDYEFRNKAYIVQALSHPSNRKNTDYQMLEFVGDAVIDFLITSYISEYCGDLSPGKVTDLRASLVNNKTFGTLCVKLGFHKFLLSDSERLTDSINYFEHYQKQKNFRIDGNDMMEVISNGKDKTAKEVEVPKALGDIFESLAGAIFLDSGNNFDEVWRVYYNIMKELIDKFSNKIPINPVRALYEELNLKTNFSKVRSEISGDGIMTMKLTIEKNKKTMEYYGRGENTDLCKRAAAKFALKDFFKRNEFFI